MSQRILLKVRLILEYQGMVLLLKQTSENGGKYTLVGGTIENEEFAKSSLIRESREEAGITLKPDNLQLVHILHKKKGKNSRVVLYFKSKNWKGEPSALERHKFKKVEWFSLDELPKNMSPTVRHVFERYKEGETYSEYLKE
jgi:8-oxo-dGTP pyrophosphatase MutT (NUDIX family)